VNPLARWIYEKMADERRRLLKAMTDEQVKALWDEDDGTLIRPDGIDCDDVHAELNRRGLGDYCAV